jgi:hypothetical protein
LRCPGRSDCKRPGDCTKSRVATPLVAAAVAIHCARCGGGPIPLPYNSREPGGFTAARGLGHRSHGSPPEQIFVIEESS